MAETKTHLGVPRLFPRGLFEWPDVERWFPGAIGAINEDVMRVEELHKDGEVVVRAEMPGIDPEKDVDIRVVDGALHISVEKRKETTVEEKDVYRSEFHYGAYARVLPLPPGCSEKDVKASYKDGVLEVHVPVQHEAAREGTKVAVTRG